MKSGNLDIDYLAKILVFALATVQKLSSPANDDKQTTSHQQLLKELAEICEERNGSKNPHAIAMIKGLRFVLEQIQVPLPLLMLLFCAVSSSLNYSNLIELFHAGMVITV